jgi:hypothetical protein
MAKRVETVGKGGPFGLLAVGYSQVIGYYHAFGARGAQARFLTPNLRSFPIFI